MIPAIRMGGVALAGLMLPLYAFTLGLSALLMFWVQPLYARLALPLLGGAPAVWITAMLFFQAVLLAGYLYAHLSVRWLGLKRQSLAHAMILLVAFAALPVAIPAGWPPPPGEMPIAWLIGLFAAGVGLPFFALSATAPLLQRWFAHTGHKGSADPYFLYSASNIGSVAALIGYPLLAEPLMRLGQQTLVWTVGYGLLVLSIAWCGLILWRRFAADAPGAAGEDLTLSRDITWRRRAVWVVLAFAPSSLMLGVTLHISTDLAAVPLLWVVPLTLYLLSFVIVFARRPLLRHKWMLALQPLMLVLLAISMSWDVAGLWGEIAIHLAAFFISAMVCHGELAARRPAVTHLTEFYLWMAVGGVLGGLFNAVLAPVAFDSVLEYPLVIAFVCLLRPWEKLTGRKALALDVLLSLVLALAVLALPQAFDPGPGGFGQTAIIVAFSAAVSTALTFAYLGRPPAFALGMAVLLAAGPVLLPASTISAPGHRDEIFRERSFFGVHRVMLQPEPVGARILLHGTTVHGAQFVDPEKATTPLTYYHPQGPLGTIFDSFPGWRFLNVGVVGLGAGATACYARRGQDWTFFEIDPVVERIARDERFFTFLRDCKPDAKVVIGDARLSLQNVPDGRFDLLILDAFSSDAIPVHLLTAEAFALYRRKLADGGVLAAHISNQFLDLEPVVGRVTAEVGFFGVVQYDAEPDEAAQLTELRFPSVWVVMARRPDDILELAADLRWEPLRGAKAPLWADDYVNKVRTIRAPESTQSLDLSVG